DRRVVVGRDSAGIRESGRRPNEAWPLAAEQPPGLGLGPATVRAQLRALSRRQWARKEWAAVGGEVVGPGCDRGDRERGPAAEDAGFWQAALVRGSQGGRGVRAVPGPALLMS